MNKVTTHPLLNPNSTHYQMVDGVEAIERLEEMFTPEELMVWAKITAMKYRLRIGNKDEPVAETLKIQTYEAYYKYLDEMEQTVISEKPIEKWRAHKYNCKCATCKSVKLLLSSLFDNDKESRSCSTQK